MDWATRLFHKQMASRQVGWNGRQIQNAMKSAVALAEYDSLVGSGKSQTPRKPVLELKWLDVVAHASWEFDAYLERAVDMSTVEYAKHFSRRDDKARRDQLAMPFTSGPSSWQAPPGFGSTQGGPHA
ncbi:hypothetical protein VMCG_04091 [Cytospora schulzeri]|uniref:AAA+ ATPase lid domain-containing protein n=1 Tax=Cytospora schulzeri TaxID=448051 RepID=A0A423WTH2_9PEZI|nr:hypothetical protein VMCG_04091 [Valsa malicola]